MTDRTKLSELDKEDQFWIAVWLLIFIIVPTIITVAITLTIKYLL